VGALRYAKGGGVNQARNRTGIGPGRESSLLRPAQPRRGHEFHGPRNLLRILHGANAALDVELRGHGVVARQRLRLASGRRYRRESLLEFGERFLQSFPDLIVDRFLGGDLMEQLTGVRIGKG